MPTKNYRPQAPDTSIETDRFFFSLLQQRSPLERWQMANAMILDARRMSLCGLKRNFSQLTESQFAIKVATAWLQADYPPDYLPAGNEMTWIQDSSTLAVELDRILSEIDIPYYITGGLAAIIYGEPRTTRDVDLVIQIQPAEIDRLVISLENNGFYVPGVADVKSGRMQILSVTQIATISRADLIISNSTEFDRIKFERREIIDLPDRGRIYFASVEDVILSKLLWGQSSQSEKQWRDVLGILKVQAEKLDVDYLNKWSEYLNLSNLLNLAMTESGISRS